MSLTYAFLAAKCGVFQLQTATLAAWPTLELVELEEFVSWEVAFDWARSRSGYLDGQHPHDVKLLYRNGVWSVLADISTCMSADEESLVALSRRVGRVVAATTQGTAAFAQLLVAEDGAVVRTVTGEAGRREETGVPLPEEAGMPPGTFSIAELDVVWQRLGLSSFLAREPAGAVVALHVLDRTLYPETASAPVSVHAPAGSASRPWWKLW